MMQYWNDLRQQTYPLRFVLARVLWHTKLCRLLRIRYNGFVLQFHPSAISAGLWIDPKKHREEDALFAAYLRPGSIVVDVGANIGVFSLSASRIVGASGKVHSLEAHPQTFRYLKRNLALNVADNVMAYHVAAGNVHGTLRFSDKIFDDQNTVLQNGAGLEVPARTLDELLPSERHIHLLKVDVEGYEKFVFEGASKTLSRTETVCFEAWDEHFIRFGYGFDDVWQILHRQGFEIFRFPEAKHIAPVPGSYRASHREYLVAVRNGDDFIRRMHCFREGVSVSEEYQWLALL